MSEIIQSGLLSAAGLRHGFTTRALGDVRASLDAWEKKCGLSASRLAWVEQVHRAEVKVVCQPPPRAGDFLGRADAVTSSFSQLVLAVRTADCLPILLADPDRRVAAAVHAGWRGTLAGVVENALSVLRRIFGSRPERLLAALGPHIRPCCYQVGPEVHVAFLSRFGQRAISSRGTSLRVDLAQANRLELLRCGVLARHIETLDLCTSCRQDLFFSWRRDGESCGHQMSFICNY